MVVDLEKAGTSKIGHRRLSPYVKDLGTMTASLARMGFGGIRDQDVAANELERYVLDPYLRMVSGSPAESDAREAVNRAFDRFVDIYDNTSRLINWG